jgi:DNA-binding GntR family transcriptional regulator
MIEEPTTFRTHDVIAKDLVRALEKEIIFCELAPGARLTQEDIVGRFNVSHSPVREALRSLKQDGLIVMASRRGARVSPLMVEDLDEIYKCRIPLEALAAEIAATDRTNEACKAMSASLQGLRMALQLKNPRTFFEANVVLTNAINASTHNRTLIRLLANIGKQAFRYRYIAYQRSPDLMERSVDYNTEIVEAIISQKPRHARSLTEDVLESSWKTVRERIGALGDDDILVSQKL